MRNSYSFSPRFFVHAAICCSLLPLLGGSASRVAADYIEDRRAAAKLVNAGKYDEAFSACTKLQLVAKTQLQHADAADLAAQCAVRLRQFSQALHLAQSIQLEPYRKLSEMRVLTAQQQTAQIVARFGDDDLLKYPDSIVGEVAFFRGYALMLAKDGARAAKDFELGESYATDQNLRGEIFLNLGQAYRQLLNDDERALVAYRHVYETNNEFKHSGAAVAVSTILLKQGKYAEAQAELERIDEKKITIPIYRDALLKAKAAVAAQKNP